MSNRPVENRYLHTGQRKHRIYAHTDTHAFDLDWNPQAVYALDRAATVIGTVLYH
jgi:hypothetical protein